MFSVVCNNSLSPLQGSMTGPIILKKKHVHTRAVPIIKYYKLFSEALISVNDPRLVVTFNLNMVDTWASRVTVATWQTT
jgi:hypothetical protein